MDISRYTSHNFRIGATSTAVTVGILINKDFGLLAEYCISFVCEGAMGEISFIVKTVVFSERAWQ